MDHHPPPPLPVTTQPATLIPKSETQTEIDKIEVEMERELQLLNPQNSEVKADVVSMPEGEDKGLETNNSDGQTSAHKDPPPSDSQPTEPPDGALLPGIQQETHPLPEREEGLVNVPVPPSQPPAVSTTVAQDNDNLDTSNTQLAGEENTEPDNQGEQKVTSDVDNVTSSDEPMFVETMEVRSENKDITSTTTTTTVATITTEAEPITGTTIETTSEQ